MILNKILPLFFLPLGLGMVLMITGCLLRRLGLVWWGVGGLALFSLPATGNLMLGCPIRP